MKIVPVSVTCLVLGKTQLWGFADAPYKLMQDIARLIPGLWYERAPIGMYVGYIDAVIIAFKTLLASGVKVDDSLVPDDLDTGYYKASKYGHKPSPKGLNLREYQRTGVRFLIQNGPHGCILGDDMGLGKTVTAIAAARELNLRTLIVAPAFIERDVWLPAVEGGALRKWWPEAKIVRCEGVTWEPIPEGTNVVLCNASILHHWEQALSPEVVIFDEPHLTLVGGQSLRSDAARKVRRRAKYCWMLTGTPMQHRPRDMWNVLDICSPNRFGRNWDDPGRMPHSFGVRYCNGHQKVIEELGGETRWDFSGSSNEEELHLRLSPWMMLRRTGDDVGAELPPKERNIIWDSGGKKGEAIQKILAKVSTKTDLRGLLDRAADQKYDWNLEALIGEYRAGNRVMAFTYRREVCERFYRDLVGAKVEALWAHGGVTTVARAKRTKQAHDMARNKTPFIFVGNIDAMGTGVDLTFAQKIRFVEIVPDAIKLLQAEARAARPGNTGTVVIDYPLRRGTADELISNRVLEKLELFEKVVGKTEKLFVPNEDDIFRMITEGVEK